MCLIDMTAVAGSFMRQRVTTEIIPIVARVLGQESKRWLVYGSCIKNEK